MIADWLLLCILLSRPDIFPEKAAGQPVVGVYIFPDYYPTHESGALDIITIDSFVGGGRIFTQSEPLRSGNAKIQVLCMEILPNFVPKYCFTVTLAIWNCYFSSLGVLPMVYGKMRRFPFPSPLALSFLPGQHHLLAEL